MSVDDLRDAAQTPNAYIDTSDLTINLGSTSLDVASGVTFAPSVRTTLTYTGTGQAIRIVDSSVPHPVEYVTLRNLHIVAPNAARGVYGLWYRRATIEDVTVEGADVGFHIHGGGDPQVGAWWNTFQRARTIDCATGFKFTGSFNPDGSRNGFANANTMFDCEVWGGSVGMRVGDGVDTIRMFGGHVQSTTVGGVTVRGSHFETHGLRIENAGYGYEIAAPHFKKFGGSISRVDNERVGSHEPEVWL